MTQNRWNGYDVLDDDLLEIWVSLIQHRGENINNDHDGNSDLLVICKQCDDISDTANSAVLEIAAFPYTTATPIRTEDTLTLGEFRQAQSSNSWCQAAAKTVGLFCLDTYIWPRWCFSTASINAQSTSEVLFSRITGLYGLLLSLPDVTQSPRRSTYIQQ